MSRDQIWTILYSAPEEGPKSTTDDLERSGRLEEVGRPRLPGAIRRALTVASPERIVVALLEAEQPWWNAPMAGLPSSGRLPQPIDRGSGVGILAALVRIYRANPDAQVVLFTSDDLCRDASDLAVYAMERLAREPQRIHLVGRVPSADEDGGGVWAVPTEPGGRCVSGFTDDPSPATRAFLVDQGAVKMTPVVAAHVATLLTAYERARPTLLEAFLESMTDARKNDDSVLDELYPFVEVLDFHRDVLASVADTLVLHRRERPASATWGREGAAYRATSSGSNVAV